MIETLFKLVISLLTAGAGARMFADMIDDKTLLIAICAVAAWIVFLILKYLFLLIEKYHKPIILLETGTIGLLIYQIIKISQ